MQFTFARKLQRGDHGPEVKELQDALFLLLRRAGPSGPFGPGIARTASGCSAVTGGGAPIALLAALGLAALTRRRSRTQR